MKSKLYLILDNNWNTKLFIWISRTLMYTCNTPLNFGSLRARFIEQMVYIWTLLSGWSWLSFIIYKNAALNIIYIYTVVKRYCPRNWNTSVSLTVSAVLFMYPLLFVKRWYLNPSIFFKSVWFLPSKSVWNYICMHGCWYL